MREQLLEAVAADASRRTNSEPARKRRTHVGRSSEHFGGREQLVAILKANHSNDISETTWQLGARPAETNAPAADELEIKQRFGPNAQLISLSARGRTGPQAILRGLAKRVAAGAAGATPPSRRCQRGDRGARRLPALRGKGEDRHGANRGVPVLAQAQLRRLAVRTGMVGDWVGSTGRSGGRKNPINHIETIYKPYTGQIQTIYVRSVCTPGSPHSTLLRSSPVPAHTPTQRLLPRQPERGLRMQHSGTYSCPTQP